MVYIEKQGFKKFWWLMLPIVIAIIVNVVNWFTETDPTVKESELNGLLITIVVCALVVALFFYSALKTKVDAKGITYSFKPFVREKHYTWAQLEKVWVRKYKPIREYGGWGFRIGLGTGRAYSVWGNKGLQLVTKENKKLLIGTRNAEELATFLKRLKEKHSIDEISEANLDG